MKENYKSQNLLVTKKSVFSLSKWFHHRTNVMTIIYFSSSRTCMLAAWVGEEEKLYLTRPLWYNKKMQHRYAPPGRDVYRPYPQRPHGGHSERRKLKKRGVFVRIGRRTKTFFAVARHTLHSTRKKNVQSCLSCLSCLSCGIFSFIIFHVGFCDKPAT